MYVGPQEKIMKKLLLLMSACLLMGACATVQEAKNFANCKYAIRNVEVSDYNTNSLGFEVYLNITNLNRKTAATIKKFDGKLTMNEVYVADIVFEDVHIEPGATKTQKAAVTVPMKNLTTKLVGLVSMGSASVDYHIAGVATFDTPLGEFPAPVDFGRRGSNN